MGYFLLACGMLVIFNGINYWRDRYESPVPRLEVLKAIISFFAAAVFFLLSFIYF
jgi:hypothetical protein